MTQWIMMMQSAPGQYANFPISTWPLDRLTQEWVRLKELTAILNAINNYIGIKSTGNTLAAATAGYAAFKGAATVVRATGAVGLGLTIVSGIGITLAVRSCNNARQELEEGIETVRIPNCEIEEGAWIAIEHQVFDAQN